MSKYVNQNTKIASRERSYLGPRAVRSWKDFQVASMKDCLELSNIGIGLDEKSIREMAIAMDNVQSDVTTPTIPTPVQFLQSWLPGFVHIITAARKIDDLVGISTMGSFEDVEIVQGLMELVGNSVYYQDLTNVPFASWNVNFQTRNIVRFEEGLQVGYLEELQAARIRVDSASEKRKSAALALELIRNAIGFYGFNNGANNTYGFLNDPGLPAYVTAANGASGFPQWYRKTFLEICKDIRTMISTLRAQSQDQIDPESVNMTLALATNVVDYLSTVSDFGISVRDWMKQTYPRIRVVSAPELTAANGGASVGYLYAENINDASTDDGRTFIQVVPAKFQVVGVAKLVKVYQEDYTNATAGVMCKRPWAVTRITGIG